MMEYYKDAKVPRPEYFLDEENEFLERANGEYMIEENPG